MVRAAVKRRNGRKAYRLTELLGCTIADFRAHIETRWLPGMTWENWGRKRGCWQLDHIRPVSSFDFTDPAQQFTCFHYTNYQPLWAIDNIRKGNKWPGVAAASTQMQDQPTPMET
jgi:hypothetical protein